MQIDRTTAPHPLGTGIDDDHTQSEWWGNKRHPNRQGPLRGVLRAYVPAPGAITKVAVRKQS